MKELKTIPLKLSTLGTAKIGGLVCNKNCALSLGDEIPQHAIRTFEEETRSTNTMQEKTN
ncbi:MAG: hypothetical protein KZQ88_18405 [Candidatus Thiodiazotropha sp. (ex Dulcina madagascariensis)]|nr:hypothetical protein [Candidatus Thiodiazotropha sp. (ex Dulcina madagascariensis)]MCU7929026.1 hypothetical protein [Candidatus Thiodiazotropha sp. (ex Dulcina madagascariensis)]